MSKRRKKRKSPPEHEELEEALVSLLGSTHRKRRKKNLLEVARQLQVARRILGSLKAVAERIDVSEEMLREFASVKKLSPLVREMIKDGRLTSVEVAYRLSMLPDSEQKLVALAYAGGELNVKDVRDVVSFRKRYPKKTIRHAVERVKSSRDIVQYLVKFRISERGMNEVALRHRFSKLLGNANIVSLNIKGRVATLTINEEGQKRLQAVAKERGMTKGKLVRQVIQER